MFKSAIEITMCNGEMDQTAVMLTKKKLADVFVLRNCTHLIGTWFKDFISRQFFLLLLFHSEECLLGVL